MPEFELNTIDLATVVLYLIFIIWLGFRVARLHETTDDYFLAGRSLAWPLVGLSLYASNMSSSSLIGLAGQAYKTGISVYNYEWMAAIVLAFFAVFFLPFYLRTGVYTMPEFLERRFDQRSRYYFSGLTIVGNIVIDTAGSLYAGGLVVQLVYPEVPLWISILVLALLAGTYTIAGGLLAVVYTDAIQSVLLILGAILISFLAFAEVGSWEAATAGLDPGMMSVVQPLDDPFLPWLGLLTGVPLLGFYFWCTNQFMVQRVLGAKDENHGRWGALFAGALKVPVIFIMVLPGIFALQLYPGLERPDQVFPTLMFDLLPVGIRGIMITALVAAIMSSIDSTLNSASTLVTMDFVKKLRPRTGNAELVRAGRITTFLFMVAAAAWAPQIARFPSLFEYLQSILAYLAPPIVACFVIGLFWRRANRHGAFLALVGGHAAAAALMAANAAGLVEIHFLYVPAILVAVSGSILVAVSLAGEAPAADRVEGLTWTPRVFRAESRELAGLQWWKNYRYQALVLVAVTALFVAAFW